MPAEQGRLQGPSANEVIRDHEELLSSGPGVVLGHCAGQFGNPSGGQVALQQQMEHRHEMAFAAAETPVQIAGPARLLLQRVFDQPQRFIEVPFELWRDDVGL